VDAKSEEALENIGRECEVKTGAVAYKPEPEVAKRKNKKNQIAHIPDFQVSPLKFFMHSLCPLVLFGRVSRKSKVVAVLN
jgi:hypothetical protein